MTSRTLPPSPNRDATPEDPESAWQAGVLPEIAFWDDFMATGGGQWPDDYQRRIDPQQPLQEHIMSALGEAAARELKILDVGAGPLTHLGKVWPGHVLSITAIDPLADAYAELLAKHQIVPPIPTEQGFAERLVEQFGENQFDLVHARNCIDHGLDPVRAIEQMVAVAKPGGVVYMHHAINEAITQGYHGLHQWNLFGTPQKLYVGSRTHAVNMTWRLARTANVANQIFEDIGWMVTIIHKRPTVAWHRRATASMYAGWCARPGRAELQRLLASARRWQKSLAVPATKEQ